MCSFGPGLSVYWPLKWGLDHYALSALGNLIELVPGPMAQASTFRAFGAGKLTFDTASKIAGLFSTVR